MKQNKNSSKYVFEFNNCDKLNILSGKHSEPECATQDNENLMAKIEVYKSKIASITAKNSIVKYILVAIVILVVIAAIADSDSTGERLLSLFAGPIIFGGMAYGAYIIYILITSGIVASYSKAIKEAEVEIAKASSKKFEVEQKKVDAVLHDFLTKPTNNE